MTLGTFLVAWVPGRGGDGLSSGGSGEQSEVEDQPITHHHHHHHKGEHKIKGKREAAAVVVHTYTAHSYIYYRQIMYSIYIVSPAQSMHTRN